MPSVQLPQPGLPAAQFGPGVDPDLERSQTPGTKAINLRVFRQQIAELLQTGVMPDHKHHVRMAAASPDRVEHVLWRPGVIEIRQQQRLRNLHRQAVSTRGLGGTHGIGTEHRPRHDPQGRELSRELPNLPTGLREERPFVVVNPFQMGRLPMAQNQ